MIVSTVSSKLDTFVAGKGFALMTEEDIIWKTLSLHERL